ncbi:MAG: hypothetical protein RSH25_15485 [Bacteroides sp.]|uniref:hypothetical protein n=1 Tax=Bacteroides sp. TaxID=29523 RepID=UPI002FCBF10D
MSKIKEYILELEEQSRDRHIAKLLGVTYEELIELDWHIESNDNQFYSYIVKFEEYCSREILNKIQRLKNGNIVYLESWEIEAEYDFINDQFDAITECKRSLNQYNIEIDEIYALSQLQKEDDPHKERLNRQMFIGVIGVLEAFLSEIFMRMVFEDDKYLHSFIKNHPAFKSEKIELSKIFEKYEEIPEMAKSKILDTVFHNLFSVKRMYEDTFSINFPAIEPLRKYILIRHDLVHRNGKTKDHIKCNITDTILLELIQKVKAFMDDLKSVLDLIK